MSCANFSLHPCYAEAEVYMYVIFSVVLCKDQTTNEPTLTMQNSFQGATQMDI